MHHTNYNKKYHKKMAYQVVKNLLHGYWEILPKPESEILRQYYEEKYYQDENATYSHAYSVDELVYFETKIKQKAFVLDQLLGERKTTIGLLDIGCGEGFALDYFYKKGWAVQGIDFSDFAIQSLHPHLMPFFQKGNIWETIDELLAQHKKYDVVWLDNVLEHVVDPVLLLNKAHELTADNGVLLIEVPNDFTEFQQTIFDKEIVNRKYWEAYPDHLVYFTRESLISLCESIDWQTEKVLADFPIEWFLLNQHSNYCNDKTVGKQAHAARVFLENFLEEKIANKNDLMDFYESMSKIGQGREIIGFFRKRAKK